MTDPTQPMRLLIVIGAKNEESQLEKTVRGLEAACSPGQVAGIVLMLAQNATEGCRRTADELCSVEFPIPVEAVVDPSRNLPASLKAVLGGRQDASHTLFLAADYFLDSSAVAGLVARAAQDPGTIYKISRAMRGGSFSPDYSPVEVLLYRLFCVFIRILYSCSITDPAFFVMVMPISLFLALRFKQASVPFGVEMMYALLRSKALIAEIPADNLPRTEMHNSSTIRQRLRYATIAVGMRFMPRKKFFEERQTQ